MGLGSFGPGVVEASAGSGGQCGCWRRMEGGGGGDQGRPTNDHHHHLAPVDHRLRDGLQSHRLNTLFIDDLEVKLGEEVGRREAAAGDDLVIHNNIRTASMLFDGDDVTLKSSKRCHCRERDLRGGEADDASTAKRMRTEQVVLSL